MDGAEVDFVTVSDFDEFTHMLVDRHPMFASFADGAARFVGGLSTSFLSLSKVLFTALSDPEHLAMFDCETAAELARVIPWSRVVDERRTTRGAAEIDLVPYIAAHREELVLKPASGHGGCGVVLGWRTAQGQWEETIARARREPYVVQERVAIPRERTPFAVGKELRWVEHAWDFCPFVWNGDWSAGALVRVSSTDILNVGAGSGVDFPWFVVRDA